MIDTGFGVSFMLEGTSEGFRAIVSNDLTKKVVSIDSIGNLTKL